MSWKSYCSLGVLLVLPLFAGTCGMPMSMGDRMGDRTGMLESQGMMASKSSEMMSGKDSHMMAKVKHDRSYKNGHWYQQQKMKKQTNQVWIWVGAGVAVVAGVALIVFLRRRKKA